MDINKQSVEDAIKQLVLANADGEVKSLAYVIINQDGEPELQIAMAPGTGYAIVTALEVLKQSIINKLVSDGGIEAKDRE